MPDSKDTPDLILDQLLVALNNSPWLRRIRDGYFREFRDKALAQGKDAPTANAEATPLAYAATTQTATEKVKELLHDVNSGKVTFGGDTFGGKKYNIAEKIDLIRALQEQGLIKGLGYISRENYNKTTLSLSEQGKQFLSQQKEQQPYDISQDFRKTPLQDGNFYEHVSFIYAIKTNAQDRDPKLFTAQKDQATGEMTWAETKSKPFGEDVKRLAEAMVDIDRRMAILTQRQSWDSRQNDDGSIWHRHKSNLFGIKESTHPKYSCSLFTRQKVTDEISGEKVWRWQPAKNPLSEMSKANIEKAMIEVVGRIKVMDKAIIQPGEELQGTVKGQRQYKGKTYVVVETQPAKDNGKPQERYVPLNAQYSYQKGGEIKAIQTEQGLSISGGAISMKNTAPSAPTTSPGRQAPKLPGIAGPSKSKGMGM